MSTLARHIAGLSDAKRALLLARLAERQTAADQASRSGSIATDASSGEMSPVPEAAAMSAAVDAANRRLSPAQERLWVLEQMEPGGHDYHIYRAFEWVGPLDEPALARSLAVLARRHDSLRMAIAVADDAAGTPIPTLLADGSVPLETMTLDASASAEQDGVEDDYEEGARIVARPSSGAETDTDAELTGLLERYAQAPFDLRRGPLWRALLVTLAPERHVFLFVVHHIVFDGVSMRIFLDELGALYRQERTGQPAALAPLASSYAEAAARQREQVSGERLAALNAYWRARLAGAPPELTLPTDYARPAVKSRHGAIETRELRSDTAGALREVARRQASTTFMLLAAAFAAVLSQQAGQEEVCIGTPVSGRPRPELDGIIGLFVNTVVLRADLSGDPLFSDLLARLRAETIDAVAHQDLPFNQIVDAVNPARAANRSPLFQVMLAMHGDAVADPLMDGLHVRRLPLARHSSLFDLELTATHIGNGPLALALEYDSDLFEPGTIARLLDSLCRLLIAVSERPDRRLSDLLAVDDAMRARLAARAVWTDAGRTTDSEGLAAADRMVDAEQSEPRRDRLIHDLFEARARLTPDAPALDHAGRRLTYRELDERSNQLAHYLQRLGAAADTRIPVCLDRSLDTIVALLGIWKAGGTYIPIDPSLPAERMAIVLRDTDARLLLTSSELAPRIPATTTRVVSLDRERAAIDDEPTGKPVDRAHPQSLAYIIYTSGSTGQPKGVAVAHAPAAQHLDTIRADFGYRPEDRVLQFASLSFDVSIEQILAPLFSGATVVIEQRTLWDLAEFPDMVARLGLTVINVPPAYWAQLAPAEQVSAFGALRLVIVGGDTMPVHIVKRWQDAPDPKPALLNAYGPTETVMTSTLYPVPPRRDAGDTVAHASSGRRSEREPARIPIGPPLAYRTAYIVDPRGRLVPEGVWGELFFGGALLARGYWNDAAMTAERFVPDPFGAPGGRLYRSGDICRYRADGALEFLGRRDGQVKIRGYRIELGDVERALYAQQGVLHAAVVVRARAGGERQLIAYVECVSGSTTASRTTRDESVGAGLSATGERARTDEDAHVDARVIDRLRAGLRSRLPEYMCPAHYVLLAEFPRTASGKLNRQALPDPEPPGTAGQRDGSFAEPRTAAEHTLAEIWASVLGVARVGVRDNFFEIGGDSILGLQIVAHARRAGLVLTPRQLFQHQSIESLARAAEEQRTGSAVGGASERASLASRAGEPVPEAGPVPLTPIQHRFFAQADEANASNGPGARDAVYHFNQAFLFAPPSGFRFDWFARALAIVVSHHDALRLRFERTQDGRGWQQRYVDAAGASAAVVERVDLRATRASVDASEAAPGEAVTPVEAPEARDALLRAALVARQGNLDITHGPVLTATWFDWDDTRGIRLLIVAHHLVIDGVSWRILLEDLETAYAQVARADTVTLPPRTTSYRRWAEHLETQAQRSDGVSAAERIHWLREARTPVDALACDDATGRNTVADEERMVCVLPEAETQRLLTEAGKTYSTRVPELLLAALSETMHRWRGHTSLRVALEGHGREDVGERGDARDEPLDLTRAVGWFTSLYPVRLTWRGDESIGERVQRVRDQLRAIPNHGVGYGLLRYVRPEPELACDCAIVVNYLGQFDQAVGRAAWLPLAPESSGPPVAAAFPRTSEVDLNALVLDGRLQMAWTYSQRRYNRGSIEALATQFEACLRELIDHCTSAEPDGGLDLDDLQYVMDKLTAARR